MQVKTNTSAYNVMYVHNLPVTLKVILSLIPCPLFPQETVDTGNCVEAMRDS